MKKKTGRPTKAARDCMVPMSASVPAPLRDLIDRLADDGEVSRSAKAIELLTAGIEATGAKPKRRRRAKS